MHLIPLRSRRRACQSPAIGFRIGPAVVEESAIELWACQGTYKDTSHKGHRFHGLWCDIDVLYTAAWLASSPTTSRNQIQVRPSGCGGICNRVLGLPASYPIQPCNFMNNSPLGMNLIPLYSWRQAQEPPGVGIRIHCTAMVECFSWRPGVWIFRLGVVMKRVCRVTCSLRLSAEKPPGTMLDYRVLWLSPAFRLELASIFAHSKKICWK